MGNNFKYGKSLLMADIANVNLCPFCGSENVRKAGKVFWRPGYGRLQRYSCKDCRYVFTPGVKPRKLRKVKNNG